LSAFSDVNKEVNLFHKGVHSFFAIKNATVEYQTGLPIVVKDNHIIVDTLDGYGVRESVMGGGMESLPGRLTQA